MSEIEMEFELKILICIPFFLFMIAIFYAERHEHKKRMQEAIDEICKNLGGLALVEKRGPIQEDEYESPLPCGTLSEMVHTRVDNNKYWLTLRYGHYLCSLVIQTGGKPTESIIAIINKTGFKTTRQ